MIDIPGTLEVHDVKIKNLESEIRILGDLVVKLSSEIDKHSQAITLAASTLSTIIKGLNIIQTKLYAPKKGWFR